MNNDKDVANSEREREREGEREKLLKKQKEKEGGEEFFTQENKRHGGCIFIN